MPQAESLSEKAASLESSDRQQAAELYQRAAVVYRIGRFPYISSPLKRKLYESQRSVYMKAASLWDVPIEEVIIPHKHAGVGDDKAIPLYLRMPPGASAEKPCPTILLMTGLDGHRPDNTMRTDEFLKRGWATVMYAPLFAQSLSSITYGMLTFAETDPISRAQRIVRRIGRIPSHQIDFGPASWTGWTHRSVSTLARSLHGVSPPEGTMRSEQPTLMLLA